MKYLKILLHLSYKIYDTSKLLVYQIMKNKKKTNSDEK